MDFEQKIAIGQEVELRVERYKERADFAPVFVEQDPYVEPASPSIRFYHSADSRVLLVAGEKWSGTVFRSIVTPGKSRDGRSMIHITVRDLRRVSEERQEVKGQDLLVQTWSGDRLLSTRSIPLQVRHLQFLVTEAQEVVECEALGTEDTPLVAMFSQWRRRPWPEYIKARIAAFGKSARKMDLRKFHDDLWESIPKISQAQFDTMQKGIVSGATPVSTYPRQP